MESLLQKLLNAGLINKGSSEEKTDKKEEEVKKEEKKEESSPDGKEKKKPVVSPACSQTLAQLRVNYLVLRPV